MSIAPILMNTMDLAAHAIAGKKKQAIEIQPQSKPTNEQSASLAERKAEKIDQKELETEIKSLKKLTEGTLSKAIAETKCEQARLRKKIAIQVAFFIGIFILGMAVATAPPIGIAIAIGAGAGAIIGMSFGFGAVGLEIMFAGIISTSITTGDYSVRYRITNKKHLQTLEKYQSCLKDEGFQPFYERILKKASNGKQVAASKQLFELYLAEKQLNEIEKIRNDQGANGKVKDRSLDSIQSAAGERKEERKKLLLKKQSQLSEMKKALEEKIKRLTQQLQATFIISSKY